MESSFRGNSLSESTAAPMVLLSFRAELSAVGTRNAEFGTVCCTVPFSIFQVTKSQSGLAGFLKKTATDEKQYIYIYLKHEAGIGGSDYILQHTC